jgi:hypothetical protein
MRKQVLWRVWCWLAGHRWYTSHADIDVLAEALKRGELVVSCKRCGAPDTWRAKRQNPASSRVDPGEG